MPDLSPGRVIAGRYEIVSLIGRGGTASVWRAYDPGLQREVAIKELLMAPHMAAEERQRSLREARTAARVQHPGAIPVYDIVTDAEQILIVMQFVQAPNLTERVAQVGGLPPELVAALGIQLIDTLEMAHDLGIVHRDLKPSNVMVTDDGRTCLADFGVAQIVDSTGRSRAGVAGGTPGYMSPEQAKKDHVGPESDLFSLGATLFFAAEGKGPFDRVDWRAAVRAVIDEPPAVPRKAGPLAPLLHRLMLKSPRRRPDHDDIRRGLFVVLARSMPELMAESGPTWERAPQPPRLPLHRTREGVAGDGSTGEFDRAGAHSVGPQHRVLSAGGPPLVGPDGPIRLGPRRGADDDTGSIRIAPRDSRYDSRDDSRDDSRYDSRDDDRAEPGDGAGRPPGDGPSRPGRGLRPLGPPSRPQDPDDPRDPYRHPGPPPGHPSGPPPGHPSGPPPGYPRDRPPRYPQGPPPGPAQGPPQGPPQGRPSGPPQGPPHGPPHGRPAGPPPGYAPGPPPGHRTGPPPEYGAGPPDGPPGPSGPSGPSGPPAPMPGGRFDRAPDPDEPPGPAANGRHGRPAPDEAPPDDA